MFGKTIVIVNYHYIRAEQCDNGIHAISIEGFSKQLDLIAGEGYHFISLEDLHMAICRKNMDFLSHKACLVTFDDGLKESYVHGVDVLDRKGIPAVFYIVTDPIVEQKVLPVHKFHYARKMMSDDEIWGFITEKFDLPGTAVAEDVLMEQYPWDSPSSARLKYLLNFQLAQEQQVRVVNYLFQMAYPNDESAYANDLYMDQDQIIDLAQRGYLGTHSQQHKVLSILSEDAIRNDLKNSMDVIFSLTGKRVSSVSYPYGGYTAVTENIGKICRDLGMISGVTMFRGINTINDIMYRNMMLKRVDMNDMLGGKSEKVYKELAYGV